jgi:succinate-semialdehyde dehydrogenase/glutarate-semialdehyde dehydrogenase/succinyl-CoA reductase
MTKPAVTSVNPAAAQVLAGHPIMSKQAVSKIIRKSAAAFANWRAAENLHNRTEYLHSFAAELRKNKNILAAIATIKIGKPIKEALSEIEKYSWVIEFYADNGSIFPNDEALNTDARKSIITLHTLGVIGSIIPRNFPYLQALRFVAPLLVAGNTIILGSASATLQCSIEIEKAFRNIRLPEGVFQTIVGDYTIAKTLIDSDVSAFAFTGSTSAGAQVAERATSPLKKSMLELGGSDPFRVCEDADIDISRYGMLEFVNIKPDSMIVGASSPC